ncbi:hypothetical protein GCM10009127_05950 [Alteraurantiacibacter aestuarii]|uniref:Uncharacterized protein n=1 Tax=Alteraurantiacibacter aestuarii TaxID=650004 RepID=A0A844ZN35_9SPHN|nr:hypothetical protein [Alteraurantiacibacter aestuarii]MXO89073.1 hypothetical protein [Alteraurantiacibacter aestuarii]
MTTSLTKTPEMRRYYVRMGISMAIYLVSLFSADWLIEQQQVAGPLAYLLAAIPGLCLASIFWILVRLVTEQTDEFLRLLLVRQIMVATGIALTAAAVWGFLEQYMLVGHVTAYWWPTIWCFATAIGGIYNKFTMGTAGGE